MDRSARRSAGGPRMRRQVQAGRLTLHALPEPQCMVGLQSTSVCRPRLDLLYLPVPGFRRFTEGDHHYEQTGPEAAGHQDDCYEQHRTPSVLSISKGLVENAVEGSRVNRPEAG